MNYSDVFKPHSGARAFFLSILVWGVGTGCFAATMNNFLSDLYDMGSIARGWLEFFREMPGLLLVFLFALLHKVSDWKILRIGTMISMVGVALLLVPSNQVCVTGFIMIWSLGEHLIMPCRQLIAMQVAKPEHAGQSLGFLRSAMDFGAVAGALVTALIFWLGGRSGVLSSRVLFNIVWGVIIVLLVVSTISTFTPEAPDVKTRRPAIFFHWKYRKFYALELFYGARKQIFMTFAPYVLIREYGFSTASMASLLGFCSFVNIFAAPLVGKLTDRLGYRNIMIWDTIILCGVCLMYGYAGQLFPPQVALVVICVNFLLDAVISTTSLATNIYVRTISASSEELAATMSTGISVNHLISILTAPLGGWIWVQYGLGTLFLFSAVMAIFNSLFAWTLPRPGGK